jgi:hypothetical protein
MKRGALFFCMIGLLLAFWSDGAPVEEDYSGIWQGIPEIPGMEVRLVFKIKKSDEGSYTATMDSPDQGQTNLPMDSVTVEDGAIVMTFKLAGIEVRGTLQPDGKHIQAVLKQAGMEFPMEL